MKFTGTYLDNSYQYLPEALEKLKQYGPKRRYDPDYIEEVAYEVARKRHPQTYNILAHDLIVLLSNR
jgi:hypothetical protein